MNKNYTKMKTNVANEVLDTSSSMLSLIGTYINKRYFQALRQANWQQIREDYTFNTVAGTNKYVLPDDFGKEVYVADTNNSRNLDRTELGVLIRDHAATLSTQGTVCRYVILKDRVQSQPSATGTLSVVSSNVADTTQVVLIRGIVNDKEQVEEVTLNGTSAQTSANSYSRVTSISKSDVTVGKVTVTGGSNTIAVLAPELTDVYYTVMQLHQTPSGIVTIKCPYFIKPRPLVNAYDFPVIDIADVIETGAKADAWRFKKQFAKAQVYETQFETMLAEYIYDEVNQPNDLNQFRPHVYNRDSLV